LDVLAAGWPDYGFANIKQVTFLLIFVSQKLLFLFSKFLDTMLYVMDCDPGQTNLGLGCGLVELLLKDNILLKISS